MYDMHQGGAIAFSDNKKTIKSNKLLFKALTYTQSFNALVMDYAFFLISRFQNTLWFHAIITILINLSSKWQCLIDSIILHTNHFCSTLKHKARIQ